MSQSQFKRTCKQWSKQVEFVQRNTSITELTLPTHAYDTLFKGLAEIPNGQHNGFRLDGDLLRYGYVKLWRKGGVADG